MPSMKKSIITWKFEVLEIECWKMSDILKSKKRTVRFIFEH